MFEMDHYVMHANLWIKEYELEIQYISSSVPNSYFDILFPLVTLKKVYSVQ